MKKKTVTYEVWCDSERKSEGKTLSQAKQEAVIYNGCPNKKSHRVYKVTRERVYGGKKA